MVTNNDTTKMVKATGKLFDLGILVMTQGVNYDVSHGIFNPLPYLARHANGDWGDVCDFDKKENEFSIENGYRILSKYNTPGGDIYIITEADRSSTCILYVEEY